MIHHVNLLLWIVCVEPHITIGVNHKAISIVLKKHICFFKLTDINGFILLSDTKSVVAQAPCIVIR